MRLIQRLGSDAQYREDYIADLLHFHETCRGSFDEVWLATSYGFPPIERHIENANRLAGVARRLREGGIAVSLQLSNSIGHGQYMSSRDCSGLVRPGGADPIVGEDGTVSAYCFCWHGKVLRDYLLREVAAYVEAVRPDCLWIDDDFRADNHNPVEYGCFCENCIRRFNTRYGTCFTRAALAKELLHGEGAEVRLRWLSFLREGLADLMREVCRTVHAISPKTDIGLQNASHGYTGYGLGFLYDVIREEIGRPPLARPGGGCYEAHDPNDILHKLVDVEYQRRSMPDYITCVAPEIENLPFHYTGKTPASTALETSLYLASGSTDMTYSMMMHTPEPSAFYERYFRLFAETRPYWDRLSEVAKQSTGGGISYAVAHDFYTREIGAEGGIAEYARESYHGADPLLRTGLPITFSQAAGAPLLLHPETADAMSDEEIRTLLASRVITDGETIALLQKRGFFANIKVHSVDNKTALLLRERYVSHRLTDGLVPNSFTSSVHTPGRNAVYSFEALPKTAEVLGTYENTAALAPFYGGEHPYGVSSFLLPTQEGGMLAVFGIGLWKGNISSSRYRLLLRAADLLAEGGLPALLETPEQVLLSPRVRRDGSRTLAVSVTNLTIAPIEGLRIRVRRAEGTPIFAGQYEASVCLPAEQAEDGVLLTLPAIAPYSVATVFFA